jgi:2,3-bisphosphoglycerate-independent phosphoglycerate mutase
MTTLKPTPRPVVLCILDGWGLRAEREWNAIAQANTPVWDRLWARQPHARIATSGRDVGLPDGQMGNSEVGHMNIGAGRIAVPELGRIDNAVADGTLARLPLLAATLDNLKASGGTLHLFGLLSPGGVHSHQDHIAAVAKAAARAGVPVALHAYLDGRDTPPRSALEFLTAFEAGLAGTPNIRFATVGGRYWGMDRDKRWERVARSWAASVMAEGEHAQDARSAITAGYARDENDEFVAPTVIADFAGIRDGDGLFFANFRADRARQILTALLDPRFDGFPRARLPRFAAVLGMVEYSAALRELMPALFLAERYPNTLGEVVARAGLKQLRIAETEKYAHVTFFLNGGEERSFDGEERILVPSPKVATYDLQPEMSAGEVTDKLVAAIRGGAFDLIVANFANPDMVGHTGILAAAVKAAETIDGTLARLEEAVLAAGGALLITADHGNLEEMRDPASGQPHTQHTTGPVPLVLVARDAGRHALSDGRLADLAPTVLQLMGLKQPVEMTGRSLLRPAVAQDMRATA